MVPMVDEAIGTRRALLRHLLAPARPSASIFLGTAIDDQIANLIVAQIIHLESEDPEKDISLYINSPGGQGSTPGWRSTTRCSSSSPTFRPSVTASRPCSIGALLLAPQPGRRPRCTDFILIHQPSGGFEGQASDIEIHARETLAIRERLDELYAKHTGKTKEQVREDQERDRFFKAARGRRVRAD